MTSTMQEMDAMRLAIGEVEALAAMLLHFFDASDWSGADSQLVDRTGHVLGVLATSATSAAGKFERFQVAFVDSRPVSTPVERWTDDGTAPGGPDAPGRDAELMKRDAEIVRRMRERLAEAFDCPTSYPFFRRDWLPGEDADAALIRIFKSNKQVLDRSDDDIINAIVEHERRHGRA